MLCMEKDLAIICVIHQNSKEKSEVRLDPEQLANIVIKLEREWLTRTNGDATSRMSWSTRIGSVDVQDQCCYVFWNEMTGRLEEPYTKTNTGV
jgi:hypothetical protein